MVSVHERREDVERAPSKVGETVVFHDDEFKLGHAACLFLSITQYYPTYHVLLKNCYWFAGCGFRLAQTTYQGIVKTGPSHAKLGRWSDLNIAPGTHKSGAVMLVEVAEAWNKLKEATCDFKSSLEVSRVLRSYLRGAGS